MIQTQTIGIIRDRGQLTIPDVIRKQVGWASSSSVVTISADSPDTITIKPHGEQKKVDWDKLWKMIHAARRMTAKMGNASKLIEQDRQTL